jgi:hypothetical protein
MKNRKIGLPVDERMLYFLSNTFVRYCSCTILYGLLLVQGNKNSTVLLSLRWRVIRQTPCESDVVLSGGRLVRRIGGLLLEDSCIHYEVDHWYFACCTKGTLCCRVAGALSCLLWSS